MADNLDARLLRYRNDPSREDAAELAEALLGAQRTAEALEVAGQSLGDSPEKGRLLLVAGQAWLYDGDLIRGQKALLKAARAMPAAKEPYRWLGEVLLKRGDPARAVKVLDKALKIDPGYSAAKVLRERAGRLARLAESGDAPVAIPSGPPPAPPREEATVVRPELSARLADESQRLGALSEREAETVIRPAPSEALPPAIAPPPAAIAPPPAAIAPPPAAIAPPPAAIAPPPSGFPDATAAPTRPRRALPPLGGATGAPRRPVSEAPPLGQPPASVRPPPPALGSAPALPLAYGDHRASSVPPPSLPSFAASPGSTAAGLGAPPDPPRLDPRHVDPVSIDESGSTTLMDRGDVSTALSDYGSPSHAGDDPFADDHPTSLMDGASLNVGASIGSQAAPPKPAAFSSARVQDDPRDDCAVDGPTSANPEAWAPSVEADLVPPSVAAFTPSVPAELPDVLGDQGLPALPASPVPVGGHEGEAEDVDAILAMMREQHLLEPPTEEPLTWAPKRDARPTRTRVGRTLAVIWVLAVMAAGGGWYGWTVWVQGRHAQADEFVASARQEALAGDHESLVDAERHLRQAYDLNTLDSAGPALMLFVYAQRTLEDGAFESGYLSPAIARVEQLQIDTPWLPAARATLAIGHGDLDVARASVAEALTAAPEDAIVLYLVGRVEQRLGDASAQEHLAAAAQAEPALAAASLALAELRADDGHPEETGPLLDAVLERYPGHLRGALWKAFLTADEAEPDPARAALDQLADRLDHGAPTDRVLAHLTRAHLLRRSGQAAEASAQVDAAAGAGATEPRLLAMVASEAMAIHQLPRAQQAAMAAVEAAPSIPEFRMLLARILIARRDGLRTLRILARLSPEDPQVLALSARAALLVRTVEALTASETALRTTIEATEEPSVELQALAIRTAVALRPGDAREQLSVARRLARDAAGDPDATRALGETALAIHDAALATRALHRLVAASPEDGDGFYLLGRAERMSGDAEAAETNFREALRLNPSHVGATTQLAYLLLDLGRYAEADTLFGELSGRSVLESGRSTVLIGRLGRIEALLGLGRVDDAQVQFEAVREQDRGIASARLAAARLHLAQRRPGQASQAIRDLARVEGASPSIIALYADALYAAEESEQAMAQYERALAIDRDHPEALLGYAQVLIRAEKGPEAKGILNRVERALPRRIRPPSVGARLSLLRGRAALLGGAREIEAARAAFRLATGVEGCPADAWFWLGESLAGDNAPAAREAYEHYLELAPAGVLAARARRAIR